MSRCFSFLGFNNCLLCMHMIKAILITAFPFLFYLSSLSDFELKGTLRVPLAQHSYFINKMTYIKNVIFAYSVTR